MPKITTVIWSQWCERYHFEVKRHSKEIYCPGHKGVPSVLGIGRKLKEPPSFCSLILTVEPYFLTVPVGVTAAPP